MQEYIVIVSLSDPDVCLTSHFLTAPLQPLFSFIISLALQVIQVNLFASKSASQTRNSNIQAHFIPGQREENVGLSLPFRARGRTEILYANGAYYPGHKLCLSQCM